MQSDGSVGVFVFLILSSRITDKSQLSCSESQIQTLHDFNLILERTVVTQKARITYGMTKYTGVVV